MEGGFKSNSLSWGLDTYSAKYYNAVPFVSLKMEIGNKARINFNFAWTAKYLFTNIACDFEDKFC